MSNDDDAPPDPLAELDQAIAGLATRAKVMHGYFEALKAEGFDADQALALTIAYHDKWPV